jgi:putative oxidoreductase
MPDPLVEFQPFLKISSETIWWIESSKRLNEEVRTTMTTEKLIAVVNRIYQNLPRFAGAVALLTRLFVGGFFVNTGWGKIHNLQQFTANFAGWGIPFPHFNAMLSAYTEFYGGLLTIIGLGTRVIAVPMIINMLVALFSVVLRFNVSSFGDFLNTDEPLYLLVYLWLIISGGGWLSLDSVFKYAANAWYPLERGLRNPPESTLVAQNSQP